MVTHIDQEYNVYKSNLPLLLALSLKIYWFIGLELSKILFINILYSLLHMHFKSYSLLRSRCFYPNDYKS